MPAINLKIEGLDTLMNNFGNFGYKLEREINKAIETSIFDLEAKTKPVTPIDTGRLRSSFSQNFSSLKGELSNYAPYSIFVHEGTSKWPVSIPPKNPSTVRKFFVKGVQLSQKKIEDNFRRTLDKVVKITSKI